MTAFRIRARFVDLEDMAAQAGANLRVHAPPGRRFIPWNRTTTDDGLLVLGDAAVGYPRTVVSSSTGLATVWLPTTQHPGFAYHCELLDNQATPATMLLWEDNDNLVVGEHGDTIELASLFLDGTQVQYSAGVTVAAQLFDSNPTTTVFDGTDRAEGSIRVELDDTYGIGIDGSSRGVFVIPHQFDSNAGNDGALSVTVPPSPTVSKPYKVTIWDADANTGNILFQRTMWIPAGGLDLNAWVAAHPTHDPISATNI